jgi:hypothetical protein
MQLPAIQTKRKVIAATVFLGLTAPATAAIIAVLPDIVFDTPPDVRLDQTQSDVEIKGFDEKQCVTLNYDLQTDQGRILETTPL